MKKYEKPSIKCLALSSTEDISAFLKFDDFSGLYSSASVSSYLSTSGEVYQA